MKTNQARNKENNLRVNRALIAETLGGITGLKDTLKISYGRARRIISSNVELSESEVVALYQIIGRDIFSNETDKNYEIRITK